jgi:hypothetical protein
MGVVVVLSVATSVGALAYAAGTNAAPEVLRAQRFELVDSAGNVRGLLSLGDQTCPRLVLFDEQGDARARLMLHLDGTPMLSLYDQTGRGGVALAVGEEGPRGLHVRDEEGTVRARMCADEIELRGKDGGVIWSAP